MLDVGVYISKNYTAYIYSHKIIIFNNMNCIRLVSKNQYTKRQFEELKEDILNGNIHHFQDLPAANNGIIWESAQRPWNLY